MPLLPQRDRKQLGRSGTGWLLAAVAFVATLPLGAQSSHIRPAGPGLNEAGTPYFEITSPTAMGLSAPPTDLQPLPDGRILALSDREVAIGDGTRWEIHRIEQSDSAARATQVAIAADGAIYTGIPSGIARLDFQTDGTLRRTVVAPTPDPLMMPSSVAKAGDRWYWHGGLGAVIRWKPGEPPHPSGRISDLERAFLLGGEVYLSDRSDGSFWRETPAGLEPLIAACDTNVSNCVTCGIDLGGGDYVVGTNGHGLQHFDNKRLTPIRSGGPLAGLSRINDLCAAGEGFFAAAIDNLGIVFFDRHLRTVQVLDRSLDHRLARVRRIFATRLGTVWGLLNDGVVCVEFPSRISHYESMVSTGLIFAQPYRFQGRLWLIGDGQAQRGVYDTDSRLLRFDVDTPPDEFLGALSTETGALLAGGRRGLYRRENSTWRLVLPGLTNLHLSTAPDAEGRWTFVGEGVAGWLRPQGSGYEIASTPVPAIGSVYGSITDAHGVLWAELGVARIARIELTTGAPRIEVFGPEANLAGGWVQLTVLHGEIRANVLGNILLFDPGTRRFVPDTVFHHDIPATLGIVGRPSIDAHGELWVATTAALRRYSRLGTEYRQLDEPLPSGLQPTTITPDDGGPTWLHQRLQLLRYDPDLPLQPRGAPRALITRIQLVNSNRTVFSPRGALPHIPFKDNSLVAHFLAVDALPSHTVTFEIRLNGAGDSWQPTGVYGSVTFNRLKEGSYTLQVRPVVEGTPGEIAQLAIVIEPPWYRTTTSYSAYALAFLVFVAGVAWYASWRERRKKAELALLVAQRTKELNDANRQLAGTMEAVVGQANALRASEERYRQLSTELEHRVAERTEALVRANTQLLASNQELEAFSYSISHDLRAPLRNINGFVDLLRRRNRDTLDPESQRFFQIISTETIRLGQLIDSLLAFARLSRSDLKAEPVSLAPLVAQVVAELRPEYENRIVDWRIGPLPTVVADATLLRQVVANLLSNAVKFTRNRQPAIIEIGAMPAPEPQPAEQVVFVRDNGAGFNPKYASKLFGVFQRLHHTRDFEGTGIGLANARRIVLRHGGRIWAEGSPGVGATFYFSLPAYHTAPTNHPRPGAPN
jgi:signal transduction histidine kinase